MAMARQVDDTVMLCAAKQLDAHADRPFAAAQGDKATRSCCAQSLPRTK